MIIKGTMSLDQVARAVRWAAELDADRKAHGIPSFRLDPRKTDREITDGGAMAEYAVHLETGHPLRTKPLNGPHDEMMGPDVGPWQVKHTDRWHGMLMVPAGERWAHLRKLNQAYLLVYVTLATGEYCLRGWAWGHMFLNPAYLRTHVAGKPLHAPAYCMPASELRPYVPGHGPYDVPNERGRRSVLGDL